MTYRLTRSADQDLVSIAEFGYEQWGQAQAEHYINELHSVFERLHLHRQKPRYTLQGTEIFRVNHKSHCILFSRNETVQIIAVFNQRAQVNLALDKRLSP